MNSWRKIGGAALALLMALTNVYAQGTAFTYQGRLTDGSASANGAYDFQFKLYSALSGGLPLGTVTVEDVNVTGGVFTVQLDFGATPFASNAAQFLEICARVGTQTGAYTTLTPRQPVSATPYALKSIVANDALQLNGVAASQYVQTNDPRLSDARTPTAGSANYIQNGTALQAASNFNISGNGTAGGTLSGNVVNAATQFNLGGQRVLTISGASLALGRTAGISGNYNTMGGFGAGGNNTGDYNTFFGSNAGINNQATNYNAFFGAFAGQQNTASDNAFFGAEAGRENTTGGANAFFGRVAGITNRTGDNNAFFGAGAGRASNASDNTFLGSAAGEFTTTGAGNVFVGRAAGQSNVSGTGNTLVGFIARLGSPGLRNATALGAYAQVNCDDCLVLGSVNGVNNTNPTTKVGIGTTTPTERLHVAGNGLVTGDLTVQGTLNANLANLPGGSPNYIQNGTTQQATSNFNISGNGVIGGNLTVLGTLNANLPTGSGNYIQNGTTQQATSNFNISGNGTAGGTLSGNFLNAFTHFSLSNQRVLSAAGSSSIAVGVGAGAGGTNNAFFGAEAGFLSSSSQNNSLFGARAGYQVRGGGNTMVGREAGVGTINGADNVFIGDSSGIANVHGSQNTFLGTLAGQANLYGNGNVMIGYDAGGVATDSNNLTLIGWRAFANNSGQLIHNATALGVRAQVACSNCLVLGSINGVNEATANTNVGIGVSAPQARLHVVGETRLEGNTGIGITVPQARLHVKHDSISGNQWGMQLENAAQTTFRGGLRMTNNGFFEISNNILGANPNFARLDGTGNWTAVSDRRLKTAIQPLQGVLANALKLRPVSFQYLQQAERHIGFIAQEVAEIFPSLVTNGEVNTLNYSGLSVVAIGAVQEQQQQLDELRAQNAALKAQIESLKQLVCAQHPTAAACQK